MICARLWREGSNTSNGQPYVFFVFCHVSPAVPTKVEKEDWLTRQYKLNCIPTAIIAMAKNRVRRLICKDKVVTAVLLRFQYERDNQSRRTRDDEPPDSGWPITVVFSARALLSDRDYPWRTTINGDFASCWSETNRGINPAYKLPVDATNQTFTSVSKRKRIADLSIEAHRSSRIVMDFCSAFETAIKV